jgi:signal transduction histidine kinase
MSGRSTGLVGLAERARLLGGTLSIFSMPGEGTTIEAIFPLVPAAELEEDDEA